MSDSHIVVLPNFVQILRIIILVLSVIILGLAANSVAGSSGGGVYDSWYGYTSLSDSINSSAMGFVLFVTLFSLIGNCYVLLTPMFLPVAYNMWAHLVFEVFSWIWWLGAFAAAASTAAANAILFAGLTGTAYSKWATCAAAAGLGSIAWIMHLIIGIVFCVFLHRHRKNPNNSTLSPYGVAEKHEMTPQPPQPPVAQEYPMSTPTPQQYTTSPPPQQWQQSPPPHQGGQY